MNETSVSGLAEVLDQLRRLATFAVAMQHPTASPENREALLFKSLCASECIELLFAGRLHLTEVSIIIRNYQPGAQITMLPNKKEEFLMLCDCMNISFY